MELPVQESGFPLFQSCEHVPDRPGSMGRRTNPPGQALMTSICGSSSSAMERNIDLTRDPAPFCCLTAKV